MYAPTADSAPAYDTVTRAAVDVALDFRRLIAALSLSLPSTPEPWSECPDVREVLRLSAIFLTTPHSHPYPEGTVPRYVP